MPNTNEFKSHVGQVVNGDANSATANGNVVTLNFLSKDDSKASEEKISELQRKRIYERVVKLMNLTGRERLDIYGDLLSEFSIKKIELLPAIKYKEACFFIDNEIAKQLEKLTPATKKTEDSKTNEVPKQANNSLPPLSQSMSSAARISQPPCKKCESAQSNLKTIKITNRILIVLTVIFASAFVFSLLINRPDTEPKAVQITSSVCEHSGDRFSVGGKAKNPDGTLIQCVLVNGNATWQNIERPKKVIVKPQVYRQQNDYE